MKKLLLFTIVCILAVLSPFSDLRLEGSASTPTDGGYACVLQENAFFYSAPDETRGLFLLSATYYVRVLQADEEYCQVEYLYDGENVKKLIGYAKTSALTFVEYTPEQPYFYHFFEVSYRIEEEGLMDSAFLNEITLSCAYYGDYKIGSKTYCYVLRGEEFGYVPKPADLSYEPNDEYADYLAGISETPAPDANADTSKKKGASPVQIAILVVLCLLVPVLAALILKPPRRPPYDTDE